MSRRPWLLPAALLAGSTLLSSFTILRGYAPHDEGLILAWASRVAHGQWPYRDFWSNYAPGQTMVLAALWKVFGPSLLAWRVLKVAIDAVVSLLAYRLARRAGAGQCISLLAWIAVAGAMAWPSGPGPNAPALALGLGALLAVPARPRVAGALGGLAFAFRPEIGAAATIAAALEGIGWKTWAVMRTKGFRHWPGWQVLGAAAGVAVIVLAPFAIVAGGDMWHDVIGFYGLQHLQRLPLQFAPHTTDPNKVFEVLFPVILLGCTAAWAVWATVRRRRQPAAALVIVGVLYLVGRPDEFHLVPLSVVLAVLLAGAAAVERAKPVRVGLIVLLALIAAYGLDRRGGQLLHPPTLAAVPGPAGDGVETDPADASALAALERAVNAAAPRGAPVYVADPRHDLVRVGDSALYTILDRRNPTRYDTMQPGVITTAKVQREVVRDLARTNVVVRWLDPTADAPEADGAGRSSGVHVLDDYLAADFAPHGRFGSYELLLRQH